MCIGRNDRSVADHPGIHLSSHNQADVELSSCFSLSRATNTMPNDLSP
jgi:hypothetical protein